MKLFDVRRSAPLEFVVFFEGEVAGLSLPGPRGKQGDFEVDALQCVDENKVGRLDVDPEFFAEFSLCREIRCLFGFDMATDDIPDTRIPGPIRGASADQNHA